MGFATAADSEAIERESSWEDRDLPKTTWAMLSATAAAHGERPATSYQLFSEPTAKKETLTWAELREQVAQTANLFRSLGVDEGDAVAYLLPNCTEAVLCYVGGQVAGIVNPINPLLEAEQIAAILRDTGAKVLVTLRSFPKTDIAQKAADAVALAPDVTTVIEVDLRRYMTGVKRLVVPFVRPKNPVTHHAQVLSFTEAIAAQPRDLTFADSTGDRIATYFHTGGTTGMPKLAQHLYSGVIYNGWIGARLLFRETDVIMCPLPMFHVFAAIVAMGASLFSGAEIVFPTPAGYRGDGVFDNFWKLIERYRVTFLITVPTAMSALMQRKVDADISSMKMGFSGSAPLPHELYRRFEEATGVNICEGYGLTEATCLVSINPPEGVKKVGSIGLPFPYTQVRIIDLDTGEECETDTVGEICVSSPGIWPGKTYTETAKNAEIFYPGPDGKPLWLRTGDLGRIDPDGYIWITGRAKDIIIRGGHNIDPEVIEEALAMHPAVAFAGAIGQPDSHAGEVPCAYVELMDGANVEAEDLRAFANERIPERAAHLKYLEILPELPKTAVGKTFKPALRRLAIQRVYNEALAEAGIKAEVVDVVEDKRLGLVARLARTGDTVEGDVERALSVHTRPWQWAG